MATGNVASMPLATRTSIWHKVQSLLASNTSSVGTILGPIVGLLIWSLPLAIHPTPHLALAIVGFMFVYWITEPIEPGMTALIGCFLFWALQVVPSSVAFSGFAGSTPWYVFGAMLLSTAVSRSGLAERFAAPILRTVGPSYSRLLFGLIVLVVLLQCLIPTGTAQLAIVAPLVIGIVTTFRLQPDSNMAKGLFIAVTYSCSIFNKMFLSGGSTILAHGIIEERTGIQILWSQWFIAFLPITILTIVACWLVIRWLYPAEILIPSGIQADTPSDALAATNTWSRDERVALVWLFLALALWATDFLHHISPALVALGVGLVLVLPKIGVLDTQAVKSVNLLLIIFVGGALSMGNVLVETKALNVLTERLVPWAAQLMSDGLTAALTVYWGGFLYHFLFASEYAYVSTGLPILLELGQAHGYNLAALGMLWSFAGNGKLFIYQNSILVLGYSYGYFSAKDILKVGGILTLLEGLFLMVIIPVYWPMIDLPWTMTPPVQTQGRSVPVEISQLESSLEKGRKDVSLLQQNTSVPATSRLLNAETAAWASIRNSTDFQDFTEFLAAFPETRFAFAARMRLRQLQRHEQTKTSSVVTGAR